MKIFYQWKVWAYSHKVWIDIWKFYNIDKKNIIWAFSFKNMFENILEQDAIWIVPIENSYAWSVHENFYHMNSNRFKILGEYFLPVRHSLLSYWNSKKKIKKVYSHYQALMQCERYLSENNIQAIAYQDTAWSAQFVANSKDENIWWIASEFAWEVYNLNILERNINDELDNTTRFLIVTPEHVKLANYSKNWKISILFKTKDTPAALYKCLWAFATRDINLSKIESLPAKTWKFKYMFWIDFQEPSSDCLESLLTELWFFAIDIKILWKY